MLASLTLYGASAHAQNASEASALASVIDSLDYEIDGCDNGEAGLCETAAKALLLMPQLVQPERLPTLRETCLKGDSIACWIGGEMLLGHVVTDRSSAAQAARRTELDQATNLFRKACDGSAMPGCLSLAHSYWRGRGVTTVRAKALIFMQKSCDGGYPVACTELAHVLTERMEGFELDPARAAHALFTACKLDDAFGCFRLAESIDEAPALAQEWNGPPAVPDLYKAACDSNIASACALLAQHYDAGEGVPEDDEQALSYFQRACDLGDAQSCTEAEGKRQRGETLPAKRS